MDTKQPLTLFVVAILAASVFSVVGLTSMPLQKASAQDVTIETSADGHGGTFFGEAMLQVIIEDENADDTDDSIDVTVDLESSDGDTSEVITVPDTNDGSQRFEFFIVHTDATDKTPADPDTTAALSGDQILEFGDGAAATELEVTGLQLFEDASFEITYGDVTVTIDYEEAAGVLTTDRDVYGSTSLIYIRIQDQDANLDPTDDEAFTVPQDEMEDVAGALFEITGGNFPNATIFEETGDNTAVFEATLQLDDAAGGPVELVFTTDVVTLQLNDKAQYTDITGGNNTSLDTSETSFEIDDSDGEIDDLGTLTFGTELVVTVRDQDQNIDSEDEDDIPDALVVESNGGFAAGGDTEEVDLTETGDNTGVFEIDLANGELRMSILDDDSTPTQNNGILEFNAEDIDEDIVVSYVDPLDDDSTPNTVAEFTVSLDITPGQLSAPDEVGVTDEFTVTLTDADLNDNPRVRDSYTILLTGASPFNLTRGGDDFAEIYTFELELDGEPLDFDTEDVSVTMSETGINTGVFEFEIDMEDISDFGDAGDSLTISDGDEIEVAINDFMSDPTDPDEDSVTVTIGKPSVGLDFDRTSPPIPPEPDMAAADPDVGVGTDVIVRLILVDPILNNQTNVEQSYDLLIGEDEHEFTIEVEGDDVDECTLDGSAGAATLADCDLGPVTLDDILEIGDLEETSDNTGVFEAELTFSGDADLPAGDWQDMEVTFTYFNDEGDEESAGFTFRGSDGFVTVDQPSAKAGTIMTVTVEDQDLNLDSQEVESFESTLDAVGDFVLAVQTEDDEIAGGDTQTFEETGEDTGVFTAEFEVGDDIPLVDVAEGDQATNILITYNDEIDSTGGGGDEIEVNVPVVSSTGSIRVTPELVGPATTLTVLIIDADLDEDASSTDDYTEAEVGDMVEFASSRNEVGEAVPDIEETGPNTGVFMFELELITDANDCADDDLSAAEYDATGGDTDSTIGACPGDLISIRYEDERTGSGAGSTVSEIVEVSSWDPEFVADKDSYSIGDRVTISISDPDANRDPDIADTLSDIRVISDSDRVGEEFSALETGKDTGVFRLTFGTTSGTAGGAISVKQGDDITVRYTDEFPADFEEQEEDKDFLFVVPIGGGGEVGSTTVTPPTPRDVTGEELDEVSAGQQVVLTTNVVNNNAAPQPFVALLEVRDSNGVTIFLAWQTGTLPADGETQVGLSWTPEEPGDYEVRTFVISDLNNPRVLSLVSASDITVN